MAKNTSSNHNRASSFIGFSSAGIASLLPRLHQIYVGRKAAILIPVACGSLAWISWRRLVTKPLTSKELQCSPCACIRGTTIAVWGGCILPSFILAFIGLNRRNLFRVRSLLTLQSFFKEFTKPYNADKPYILGLWGVQGVLGFGAASWEFSQTYLKIPPPSWHDSVAEWQQNELEYLGFLWWLFGGKGRGGNKVEIAEHNNKVIK